MSLPTLFIDGAKVDADVSRRLTGLTHTRTMDGAASLTTVFDDPGGELLRSGLVSRATRPHGAAAEVANFDQAAWAKFGSSRLVWGDWFTRLAGVNPTYDANGGTLSLDWEDESASLMRHQHRAVKSRRNWQTRAQFIFELVSNSTHQFSRGDFFSPELDKKQPVASVKKQRKHLQKGLSKSAHLTIKHFAITREQRANLEIALGVADDLGANDLPMLAMLCSGIGESTWTNVTNSLGYGGVLQGQVSVSGSPNWFGPMDGPTRTKEEAKSFLLGGRGFQGGGAIAIAHAHPDWLPGQIGAHIEGAFSNPDSPSTVNGYGFYQQWISEAQDILSAWGGASSVEITRSRFSFRAGGRRSGQQHNYWDDAGTLAKEVRWRLYADQNTVYYVSDNWLFGRQPSLYIDKGIGSPGVLSITPNADVGIPIAEIQVATEGPDWVGAPGSVIELGGLGPLDGRWLLWTNQQDVLLEQGTLTLRRPAPKKKEPAPTLKKRVVTTQTVDPTQVTSADMHGTPRDIIDNLVLPLARQHSLKSPYGLALTPANNDAANHLHSHLGNASDHAGPPKLKWAADCSNGSSPTKQMDAFSQDIAKMFGIPWPWNKIKKYTSPTQGGVGIAQNTVSGYRIQLIYRYYDPQAGNHFNHVHVGVRLENQ